MVEGNIKTNLFTPTLPGAVAQPSGFVTGWTLRSRGNTHRRRKRQDRKSTGQPSGKDCRRDSLLLGVSHLPISVFASWLGLCPDKKVSGGEGLYNCREQKSAKFF